MPKLVKIEEEIEVPKGVTFTLKDRIATAKGKQGTITKDFNHVKDVFMEFANGKIRIWADFPRQKTVALVKTLKFILTNMFNGVLIGFTYRMKIVFQHFPITVEPPAKGSNVILIKNFQGEREARTALLIGDCKLTSDKETVTVTGVDKESVGLTCANIQRKARVKNKDLRIFLDGVYIFQKQLGDKILWEIK